MMADFTVLNMFMLPDTWYAVTAVPSTVAATLDDVSVSLEHVFSDRTLFFKTPASEGKLAVTVTPLPWSGDMPDPGNSSVKLIFILSVKFGAVGRALFIMLKHRAVSQMTLTIASPSGMSIEVVPEYDTDGQYYYYLFDTNSFDQTTITCTWRSLSKGEEGVIQQYYTTTYLPEGPAEGVMLSWTHDPFEYEGAIIGYSVWRGTQHLGVVRGCEYLDRQITDAYRMSTHTYQIHAVGRGMTSGMNPYSVLGLISASDVSIKMVRIPMCLLSGSVNEFCYAEIEFDTQVMGGELLGGSTAVPVVAGRINKYLPQGSVCTLTIQSMGIKNRFAVPEAPSLSLQTILQ